MSNDFPAQAPIDHLAEGREPADLSEGAGLRMEIDESVATIVFDRPAALNAVNVAMATAFRDAIERVALDPSVRVLMLRGQGRAFMAGGDIGQMSADPVGNAGRIIGPLHQGLLRMSELPIPVLASLHGAVAGAGMSIALAADLAVSADDAQFQMAYTRIGASPDASGSWHLARLVGLRKAMELTLLSETIDAPQALALGLVNRVVPAAQLASYSRELAARLAAGAVHAFGRSKALLRGAAMRSLGEQLEAERIAFLEGAAGAEFREGVDAFLAKRRPDFPAAAPGVNQRR